MRRTLRRILALALGLAACGTPAGPGAPVIQPLADPGPATDPGTADPGTVPDDDADADRGPGDPGGPDGPVACTSAADCAVLWDPAAPCLAWACAAGTCVPSPVPDGTACASGSRCRRDGGCKQGVCIEAPVACDDHDPCTDDGCAPATGCTHAPAAATAPCDDGNGCTTNDRCTDGGCRGTPTPGCACAVDADCAPHEDGNRCNGTLRCAAAACEVDPATVRTCDGSKDTDCLKMACQPATGVCVPTPVEDGLPCDDWDACTLQTTCTAGACGGGVARTCTDANPCTDDACDPLIGCAFPFNAGPCDDGSACTTGDRCLGGACLGHPAACDDGNPCTDDGCLPETGCTHVPNDAPCDDGSPCTVGDRCAAGVCAGALPAACDDGNPCTDDLCDPVEGCAHAPNASSCDDLDPCTTGDRCEAGTCRAGTPVPCDDGNPCTADGCDPATGCTHVPAAGPCDDGDPCTVADACKGAACVGGGAADCSDGNPCTDDPCAPGLGCQHPPRAGTCDDGDPCTLGDTCKDGRCVAGDAGPCDDHNPCSTDVCDPKTGCQHFAAPGPCDDGDACTTGDTCVAGRCTGTPAAACDDRNPCTDDRCDPATGCIHVPNALPCDDRNDCTDRDACANGACAGAPRDCDDRNDCTIDLCVQGLGCVHQYREGTCDDGNPCTAGDACSGGVCIGRQAADCDDRNACTTDSCSPATGCVHAPNSLPCDDGNPCTTGDVCAGGACTGPVPRACADDNPCTEDRCDPAAGCVHVPMAEGSPCDDGNACTSKETCTAGKCVGVGTACDDGNLCTTDGCDDPKVGCYHRYNTLPCDDGNACTSGDACSSGVCLGIGRSCDDGNPCTTDLCDPGAGCYHVNRAGTCDDGNRCTGPDTCVAGKCTAGPPAGCDDGNLCTTDGCDPAAGCTHANNTLDCDDGNRCTAGDRCAGGTCTGGPAIDCADANPCTDDGCVPALGCVHADNTAPCDDGSRCTTGDRCASGACAGGPPPDCDDRNPCTTDACDPATGCTHANNTAPCDDGLACTAGDACKGGACAGGPPTACDDGNPCTDDRCAEPAGCAHDPNAAACDDHSACTTGDACKAGVCTGTPVDCDDGNPCTADRCDPASGCRHDALAPGAPCDKLSMCRDGKCVAWEAKTWAYSNTTDTRLYEGGRVHATSTAAGGLYAAGTDNVAKFPYVWAVVYRVNEATLDLSPVYYNAATAGMFRALMGHAVAGTGGLAARYVATANPPWVEWTSLGAATDLLAITRLDAQYWVAGKPGASKPPATLRACTETALGFSCAPLGLADTAAGCRQSSTEVRGAWAASPKRVFFAGVEPTMLDWPNVVVATWDGNTDACGVLGVAGQAYYAQDRYGLYVRGGAGGPGALNDIHGLSQDDVWAVGERGTIYRFGGPDAGWKRLDPSVDLPAAALTYAHDLQAVWVEADTGVHIVGTVDKGDFTTCRTPFYLHAWNDGTGYRFNNYLEFSQYAACAAGVARTGLPDVTVDANTRAVYAFGWAPDASGAPTLNRGLVMRWAKPK